MAYAFSKTLQALGQKPEGEEEQGNIFQTPQQPQPGGDRIKASSTEGSLQAPSAGGYAAQTAGGSAPQQSTTGSKNRLFSANAGRVSSPVDLEKTGQAITDAQNRVQEASDTYVAKADDRYETSPEGKVQKNGARNDAADLDAYVNGTYAPDKGLEAGGDYGPDLVTAYQQGNAGVVDYDLNDQVDTEIEQASDLATDAGLRRLFRSAGDAEYGGNEAALDTALLRKNADFNTERDQILNQNRSMLDAVQKIRGSAKEKAQKQLDNTYSSWRGAVTRDLESRLKGIEDAARLQEGYFDGGLLDGLSADFNDDYARKAAHNYGGAGLDGYIGGVNAKDFYKGGLTDDQTSWQDFVAEPDYQRFSRVMELLGKGEDKALTGAGKYVGKEAKDYTGSFDQTGWMKAQVDAGKAKKAAADKLKGGGIKTTWQGDTVSQGTAPGVDPAGAVKKATPFGAPKKEAPDNDPIMPDEIEDPLERILNPKWR